MLKKIEAYLKDDSGATAIEYSLIAALISVTIVASVGSIGDKVESLYQTLIDEIN
jgi:pilus assembly protein Flp/PilA